MAGLFGFPSNLPENFINGIAHRWPSRLHHLLPRSTPRSKRAVFLDGLFVIRASVGYSIHTKAKDAVKNPATAKGIHCAFCIKMSELQE